VDNEASGTHASLRVCRPGWDPVALQREAHWLESLAQGTDLRVPIPIWTSSGDCICLARIDEVPEQRACVLFDWVSGRQVSPEELTTPRLQDVGRFLATMHDHAEINRLEESLCLEPFNAAALEASDHRENLRTFYDDEAALRAFDRAVNATVEQMRALGEGPSVAGIIHGDFHQRNYVFDGDSVGALDFETILWGYYLYDLATTLSYLVPTFLRGKDAEPCREAVLEGYAEVRGLPTGFEDLLVSSRPTEYGSWQTG